MCKKLKLYDRCKIEFQTLSTYNSEVMRGLVHTQEHKEKMDRLQKKYNKLIREKYK